MSYVLRGGGRDGESAAGTGTPRAAGDFAAGEFAAGGPGVDITMLFRRHYPELVRLAVMLVGDRPTAEDVVQGVFARLHARRDRPGPRGDQLAYVRACRGGRARMLYRGVTGPGGVVFLSSDASGRYLLLTWWRTAGSTTAGCARWPPSAGPSPAPGR